MYALGSENGLVLATLRIYTDNTLLCRNRYVLSGTSQLPSSILADTRVTRRGKELILGDSPFHAVGANVYWLGEHSKAAFTRLEEHS